MVKAKTADKPLTAAQILAADDLLTERVETPEWGGYTLVRTMTAAEKDRYQMAQLITTRAGDIQSDLKKMRLFRARALCLTIVDAKGVRLYAGTDAEIEALGGKNAEVVDRVYNVVARMNGLSDQGQNTEDLEKNLGPDPSADSISG